MMRYNDFETLYSSSNTGVEVFMWIMYILMIVVLVLTSMALWKYINKK